MPSPVRRPGPRGESLLAAACLLYFAAQAVSYALLVPPHVPADEVTHLGRVQVFAGSPFPSDSPETHPLGLVSSVPPLYYQLLGALSHLNPGLRELVFLRLLNVGLALLGVVYALRWMRLFCADPLARGLFLVLLTNLPMFAFLAGSVSYDNLTNLWAAAATYYVFAGALRPSAGSLLGAGLCLALGCLTKTSFLPLAALLAALQGLQLWSSSGAALRGLRRPGPGPALACAALILASAGVAALYGGNLLRYGRLVPRADQVIGLEAALENRIFARNHVVAGYRSGRLSAERAREMARAIGHRGDRANTLALLRMVDERRGRGGLGDRLAYVGVWSWQMLRSTAGFAGHAVLLKPTPELLAYLLLPALAVVGWARRGRAAVDRWRDAWALALVLPYAAVLLWWVGYPEYRHTGAAGLAAQGRYLFPVWVPACGLVARHWPAAFPAAVRTAMVWAVGAWLVWQGLPWYLSHAPPAWLGG